MIIYDNKKKKLYIKEKENLPVREITLRPKEYGVWELLSRHSNEVTSRKTMCEEVWGGRYVTDFTINQTINQLRKKIGVMGKEVIITVPRKGYAMNPDLIESCKEDKSNDFHPPYSKPRNDSDSCSKRKPEIEDNLDGFLEQQDEEAITADGNCSPLKQKKNSLIHAIKKIYKSLF